MLRVPCIPTRPVVMEAGMLTIIASSFLDHIPAVAAVLGVAWYAINIWESKTVQRLLGRQDRDPA